MSLQKPETRFAKRVNERLGKNIYTLKNHNPFVGGVADWWYSGTLQDCWVEYKYFKTWPARKAKIPITRLQTTWLQSRAQEGRNCFLVIGGPQNGGIIIEYPVINPHDMEIASSGQDRKPIGFLTIDEIAVFFIDFLIGG